METARLQHSLLPPQEIAGMYAECPCLMNGPKGAELVRAVGTDDTNGRHADVSINRCPACGQFWLHYSVEYESISRSGRWAEVPIDDSTASVLRPEDAASYLDGSPWHIRGGSYWSGGPHKGKGSLRWGP